MKTIVIPVDFSAASVNAIRYATALSCDQRIDRIILLHTASVTVFDHISIVDSGELMGEERQKADDLLTDLSRMLVADCPQSVKVQTVMSDMPIMRAIHQVVKDVAGDLVLVGVDTDPVGSYLSGHVIGLARISEAPVLVVPAGTWYANPRKAVVVMRPGQDAGEWQPGGWMQALFGEPGYDVYTAGGTDPVQGLLEFMEAARAQLIVVLPGRESLFYRLTHKDIGRAIARNAHYPVLLLK